MTCIEVHREDGGTIHITIIIRSKELGIPPESYSILELSTSEGKTLLSIPINRWIPPQKSPLHEECKSGRTVCYQFSMDSDLLTRAAFLFGDMSGPFVDTYYVPIGKPFK